MLLAQVEGFLEVARRGNVSRAAEAMFVTQPTLTARLHALERELGEPLFARTPPPLAGEGRVGAYQTYPLALDASIETVYS